MDENNRQYSNGEITVFWKPKKCIHATICYTQLNEVFNPRKRPWVDMSGSTTDKIIDIVNRCPTDALTYRYNKDLEAETVEGIKDAPKIEEKPVIIQVMKDGPIVVTGKILLKDNEGKEYKTYSITSFCRCGASSNMPFCDGTHRKIGFQG
ncbi:MAG TPA: (4Fe-4S)-binding protein [Bacteroidales bacterium]|nr:(4Fe-4S)-binding protein [Bacteroidales bacterium]